MSKSDRFRRSVTPLRLGVYGGGNSLEIPWERQKLEKSLEVYSPPLSVRRVCTGHPVAVFIR